MDFKSTQSIYLQIADLVCDNIITNKWKADERIPSVRELAVELEVNPNTVMRSYEGLQNRGIIYNKRGVGYFVSPDARQQILTEQRKAFMDNEIPTIFRKMDMLGVTLEEIILKHNSYKKNIRTD